MRLTPWQGIGLLAAALVLGALAVAHAAASPTCSDADTARDGYRNTEAAKEYIAVLAEDPDSKCAKTGLRQSVRRLCHHANRLKHRRHAEDAAAAYGAIFKLEPTYGQRACEKGDKAADPPKTAVGPQGPKGDKGNAGAKGDPGEKGAKGDKGDKGDTGPKGDKGDEGDTGERGASGPRGDRGARGVIGASGERGPRGERGAPGPKGEQGDRGPTGGLLCCTG